MLQLRREGDFPFLLWKDTAPQHFESLYGEYPQASTIPLLHSSAALGCPFDRKQQELCELCRLIQRHGFHIGAFCL